MPNMRKVLVFLSQFFLVLLFCSTLFAETFYSPDVKLYEEAKECYQKQKQAKLAQLSLCANQFGKVQEEYPRSHIADDALFSKARLLKESYVSFKKKEDLQASLVSFNKLLEEYPHSNFADDALYQLGLLRLKNQKDSERAKRAFKAVISQYPNGDMKEKAASQLVALEAASEKALQTTVSTPVIAASAAKKTQTKKRNNPFAEPATSRTSKKAQLLNIQSQEKDGALEVQFDFDREVLFTTEEVAFGKRTKSLPRLLLHFQHTTSPSKKVAESKIAKSYVSDFSLKKPLFSAILLANFEIARGTQFDTRRLDNSVIVSFFKGQKKETLTKPASVQTEKLQPQKVENLVIVVDPGHGGDDGGASGKQGTREKDVVLSISKKLAKQLSTQLGAKVYLTRTRDKTLTLEDRDHFANGKKADLFLSIHANASTDRSVSGIQTYYLNNASDEASRRLASRENKSAKKKLPTEEHILSSMQQNYFTDESRILAENIQTHLVSEMNHTYKGVNDKKVRSALFYVLVGAKCPSVLIETSFISNPTEEKRLRSESYQNKLVQSISKGVSSYFQDKRRSKINL
ncbi:MAG: hypothetical protein COV43_03165 [Deltaproteobacteria bacterium CG11_big_fil_rev_8_21_14_0_20_42_23]|nr:MAG: hypothetical protein COV43_03165 [Deltaproteobacteria bacterium CG11_big_fil_rev_8_21_14_0_20_42_23]PJC63777.1 MAG: hypothetical protein CO021_07780 [Deltaproteobacteria bacterium CG_4_9_14_0_2_um_filter_42_21]